MNQLFAFFSFLLFSCSFAQRQMINFNNNWQFILNADSAAVFNNLVNNWRNLNLPHDWSIENDFSKEAPATNQGGALPGGTGWYKKMFILPENAKNKLVEISFDGVYKNSEVWINNHYLGKRPNGYVNFAYDLTTFLKPYPLQNTLIVKADNSLQPNSRWYTGGGIYRDVYLYVYDFIHFEKNRLVVTTPYISESNATLQIKAKATFNSYRIFNIKTTITSPGGKIVYSKKEKISTENNTIDQLIKIDKPELWDMENPYLYKVKLELSGTNNIVFDAIESTFGIRSFFFDKDYGFFLNNKALKIQGVCLHHDLGALGAAFNKTAAERQLQLLKEMGCNAIRFSHNPPAATMLDLCDTMGFLVIDEAFDMWNKKKNKYDYARDFKNWHQPDLEAMVYRDRNHPSVFMWSIGNEIREQFDSSAIELTKELVALVKNIDGTRPVMSALTETNAAKNYIAQANALDVLGFNYKDFDYEKLPKEFPGHKFLATETASALTTRGVYIPMGDSLHIWPPDYQAEKNFISGNKDYTCSSYDNTFAYWGNTHERSWLAVKKNKHLAGAFVWSGFDYLGEPVPYPYPARSSYFGIIDLAGFPKDIYYMYQSEWTKKPVLHLFPHWNWEPGKLIDIWVYYNMADEVELFLNGKSLGLRSKKGDELHVQWKIRFVPGTLKAVSRKNGKIVLTKEIKTAGEAYQIVLTANSQYLESNGKDLVFVTATIVDKNGILVPEAGNTIRFSMNGNAILLATDNGYQADTVNFKRAERFAWKGMALAIIQSTQKKGNSTLIAKSPGLVSGTIAFKTAE
jgi:beta-galactosidase